MSEAKSLPNSESMVVEQASTGTLRRVLRFSAVRLLTLAVVVVISVFAAILVANLGGYVDQVVSANIDETIGFRIKDGWLREVEDEAEREQIIQQTRYSMEEAAGLHSPFLLRCAGWLWKGLTLDWGKARPYITSAQGSRTQEVRDIIFDFLPRTLLVFGSANLLLFFTTLLLALGLSRRYGSWQDKLVTGLAPLAAAPSWVYGLILTGFSIHVFRNTAPSFDSWLPGFKLEYLPMYLKYMALPVAAIFLSKFFQSLYAWRTLYLVNSSEDYVEIGRAKGLPARMFENRYILRPVLPNVFTSFALLIVGLWQEVVVLETIFNVAGIGLLLRIAVGMFDVRMIVALVVVFAYLLAITVFILDLSYAFADPRVKIGGLGQSSQPIQAARSGRWFRLFGRRKALTSQPLQAQVDPRNPPARNQPMPIRAPLLREIAQASQKPPDEVLAAAQNLAEAGALLTAGDAFWLTEEELDTAVRALADGHPIPPLNRLIRERRRAARRQPPLAAPEAAPGSTPAGIRQDLRSGLQRAAAWFKGLPSARRYPAAAAGLGIILFLLLVSIYTIIAIPYAKAVKDWRGDNFHWLRNPANAQPAWTNIFRREKLPETINLSSSDSAAQKTVRDVSANTREIKFNFAFDFDYGDFPSELILFFTSGASEKRPLVVLTWLTPDGRQLDLGSFTITSSSSYYVFNDERIARKLGTRSVYKGLFGDSAVEFEKPLKGRYEMQVTAYVFDQQTDVNADFVLYGKVYGLAGTDSQRRDALMGLLWGTPVALSFGLLAAASTTLITIFLAALGVWFGGWLDALIQRMTEINMILPFFPVILMVYTLYSKSFWVLMGVTVLLSVFGSSIKNYRSLFLQIRELPYFEAARAYGAGNWRIIFQYLIPRVGTIIIPQMVVLVPSYVFLEASLAVLGLYDPLTPPTWGQLVLEGLTKGINQGAYHLIYLPAFLLLLTGYAFLLLGSSLERVFEPRLRER